MSQPKVHEPGPAAQRARHDVIKRPLIQAGNRLATDPAVVGLALTDQWQVEYPDQPARPVERPHIWEEEPDRKRYSGAATYTTSIEVDTGAGRAEIQFGECEVIFDDGSAEHGLVGPSYRAEVRPPVGEIANVRVNGIDCQDLDQAMATTRSGLLHPPALVIAP